MTQRMQIGLVFVITYFSVGYLHYPYLVYSLTRTGHWEVVMSQGLVLLSLIWVYTKGLSYFPTRDVIDIYLRMGRAAACIFLLPLVINLTALVTSLLRVHTEVFNSIFLTRTPYWAILVLLFSITTYTAIKGLGTILRSSVFIFILVIPLVVFNCISAGVNFDIHNAAPAWRSTFDFLFDIKFIYLLGFSSFLFVGFVPAEKNVKFKQLVMLWACVMLYFLISVYIPLFIFGQEAVSTFLYPILEAMDSVDIRWFMFDRQTMFFGISLVGFTIMFNAVSIWMIGQIMHKVFNLRNSHSTYWIVAFSLIAFIFALSIPNQIWIEKVLLWSTGAHVYSMVIIPLSIFIYGIYSKRGIGGHGNT
jgi:hypothetical protein